MPSRSTRPSSRQVESYIDLLACIVCRAGALRIGDRGDLSCSKCGQAYPSVDGKPLLFAPEQLEEHLPVAQKEHRSASPDPAGGEFHWKEYGIGDLLPDSEHFRRVLLLGTGDGGERAHLHDLGFETLAFDIRPSPAADFLADAHDLPLKDGTVDVVLSMQVLEHLRAPWKALEHVARVLRPGGYFVGSVAFLKPYHQSYFHMTHAGVTSLLADQGLRVDAVHAAQSMAYATYGNVLPLGPRSISRAVYGALDGVIWAVRARLWALKTGLDPDELTNRFQAGMPMSFRTFDRLRFAPAVVFKAVKVDSEQ